MSNPVTLDLVTPGPVVPPSDFLIAGPGGVVYTDIVRVRFETGGELKRGTLLMIDEMDAERVFVPCTAAGLELGGTAIDVVSDAVTIPTDVTFGILADTVMIEADEHAETAVYFEGDFNENAVIFPWETSTL